MVGEAEVLQCFPLRVGGSTVVAGGLRVQSGGIKIGDDVRVMREGQMLFEGGIKVDAAAIVPKEAVQSNCDASYRFAIDRFLFAVGTFACRKRAFQNQLFALFYCRFFLSQDRDCLSLLDQHRWVVNFGVPIQGQLLFAIAWF